jgi:hypothetical protein
VSAHHLGALNLTRGFPKEGEKEGCKETVVLSECMRSKAQLWGLLVVASVDPSLGPEKGTDGGELVKVESRQLGGIAGIYAEALGSVVEGNGGEGSSPWWLRSVVGDVYCVCRSREVGSSARGADAMLTASVQAA